MISKSSSLNYSKPPRFLLRMGYWFRLGMISFLLLSALLGTIGCSRHPTPLSWSVATLIVPKETVQAIITENSELNPREITPNVLAWAVDKKVGKLVIFNLNHPGVCGTGGCLYVGYLLKQNTQPIRVFSRYFNPSLPPNQPLFQVLENPSNTKELPCLIVQQSQGNNIQNLVFCFNGREYQLSQNSLIDKTEN